MIRLSDMPHSKEANVLSQTTGYALKALGFLAALDGKPLPIKEISRATDIPAPYLSKIVHTLARKRLLRTQRGIGGGVVLARPADAMTLYEVCEALDDPLIEERGILGIELCSDKRACPAQYFWKAYRKHHLDFLREWTVRDVALFEADEGGCG